MASIETDQVRSMFDLLKASTPVVNIGSFEFKETGSRNSPACTISYKGERIIRRELDEISPADVTELLDIPRNYEDAESVEEHLEWEHVGDTEYLREWTTPLDGNSLYITVNSHRRENSFEVHGPVEDSSTWKGYGRGTVKDIAVNGRQFETMESAFIYAVNYMNVYNPYEIDRLVRMESIAEEEFLDISGVGEKTVEEVVYEEHIRTYEEFKRDVSALSRNYREDAKDELEQKIANEDEIYEHSFVQEVSAEIAVKNI